MSIDKTISDYKHSYQNMKKVDEQYEEVKQKLISQLHTFLNLSEDTTVYLVKNKILIFTPHTINNNMINGIKEISHNYTIKQEGYDIKIEITIEGIE